MAFLHRLNPSIKFLATLIPVFVTAFATTPTQAIGLLIPPLLLLRFGADMPVHKILKRLTPFVVFFVLYVFTQAAYSAVQEHERVLHFLWFSLSRTGLLNGVTLAFRMLCTVAYGLLFVYTTDITDFIVSLCKDCRVPAKFSYGILAGIRFLPMFREEWRKLRAARQLRGQDSQFAVVRIVTYALPILSQAIRTSERVAVAMEARGFREGPRTFYRNIPKGKSDIVYLIFVLVLNLIVLLYAKQVNLL
jgi:energy-coupling factor transporter transmembrane protein EcfT